MENLYQAFCKLCASYDTFPSPLLFSVNPLRANVQRQNKVYLESASVLVRVRARSTHTQQQRKLCPCMLFRAVTCIGARQQSRRSILANLAEQLGFLRAKGCCLLHSCVYVCVFSHHPICCYHLRTFPSPFPSIDITQTQSD